MYISVDSVVLVQKRQGWLCCFSAKETCQGRPMWLIYNDWFMWLIRGWTCRYMYISVDSVVLVQKSPVKGGPCDLSIDVLAPMGWLRVVGSLKLQVSFAEYRRFYRSLLQKRPIILRSLLFVATPYRIVCVEHMCLSITGLFCRVSSLQ